MLTLASVISIAGALIGILWWLYCYNSGRRLNLSSCVICTPRPLFMPFLRRLRTLPFLRFTRHPKGSGLLPRLITQNIRQSIVADDSLSTKRKIVTIITIDGTLRYMGRVKREKEE